MAQFDIDDDEYARQQAFANTLRKQAFTPGEMRGRIYVQKDPWAAFAEGAAGGFVGSKATADRKALDDQRQQQMTEWMGRMPSATTDVQQAGPMPDGSVMPPTQVPKSPRQQAADMQRHAMEGMSIKHPLAQAAAQSGIQRAMTMPEKEAEMADRAAQRQLELALRAQQSKDLQSERLDAQKQRDADRFENQRLIKSMGMGNREPAAPQIIQSDQGAFALGRDGKLTPLMGPDGKPLMKAPSAAASKPSVRAEKEAAGVSELLEKITAAEQGLPHYSGAGTVVPSIVRQAYTSPQTKMADANMGALAAEKAHELYGAAFTAAERNRAAQFLPDIGDTTDTAKAKLAALRRIAEKKQARMQGKPDPHPNMYGDILDPSGSAPAGGAPTVVRTGTRNGVKVEQLSDGTVREVR